ncbi:DUF885 domain-containing protein [Urechidicola croceus]|uniref:DUF885 domain-containing protein n=1 Tax=Urechidicola croceus TaxID=1850246 RepID=A0A1D8PB98_9FLAO|nr:DUF885 domain-containing protein [Urechidicola croceus]AOW21855.1 hypothetical protein LPB138_14690 [Urechidicola croceus]
MKKIFLYSFICLISMISCKKEAPIAEVNPTSKAFAELLSNYNDESYKYFPLNATFEGLEGYNSQFPNVLSDEFNTELKAYYTKTKDALAKINDVELSDTEKLSKAVLNWDCDINLKALSFEDYTPINQMWTVNLMMGQLASGTSAQPFKTVEDYNNWLTRVDGYLVWLNSAEEKMREGIKVGHVLPKSLIKKVIPQFEGLATGEVSDHLFFTPAKNIPEEISFVERKNIMDPYMAMVSDKIMPAYKKMADFLKNEYLPAGRETSGIADTPNGEAYYNHQIKTYTTTNMTADEIHQLGLSEVARIRTEMEKVKEEVGYKGDLKSFFDFVRNNKELMPYKNADEVIANFNGIHDKMKPQLEKLFDIKPKTPFEVRRTEAFREASASAEYNPGSKDGSRPGIFYAPIPDAAKYNVYADEALFLHEAIPGHHYQISLTQESETLPEFRKSLWYSAYGEGWALYTESLGKELGLYTDPYQYFGMLGMEMHRAVRLVVDTGIHSKGWSREQAIKYSLDNEAESEDSITREIERYMANGGQALSYKIGQLKIRELRAKAEKALGNKFDIKEFHNQVLETGCIPLQLLENKIDTWIAANK